MNPSLASALPLPTPDTRADTHARTYHARIANLQARVAMAEAERDGLIASLDQHQYAAARAQVEELSQQLWTLRLAHLREHTG